MQPGPVTAFLVFVLGFLAVSWLPARNPEEPAALYWVAAVTATAGVGVTLLASRRAELAVSARGVDGPHTEARLGLVGPGVTALGGLATAAIYWVLLIWGTVGLLVDAAAWSARTLLGVAAIRLLPVPALDGFHLLRAALWRRLGDPKAAWLRAARLTRLAGLAGMVAGLVYSLQAGNSWGYAAGLLAWFVMVSSRVEEVRARLAITFEGVKVADVMAPLRVHGRGWLMLDAYLAAGPAPTGAAPVLLDRFDGGCAGLLEARSVDAVPREQRAAMRALDLATELERVSTVAACDDVADVAGRLLRRRGAGLLVVDAEEPVGWLSADEVERRLTGP
jgi:hypothetical protein